MDELWVHLQKFDSDPVKWHRLSQFWSSEKQPAIEIERKNKRIEYTAAKNKDKLNGKSSHAVFMLQMMTISWKCDMVGWVNWKLYSTTCMHLSILLYTINTNNNHYKFPLHGVCHHDRLNLFRLKCNCRLQNVAGETWKDKDSKKMKTTTKEKNRMTEH